jgi:hypothetical protein
MATVVKPSTLTVEIRERISLNDIDRGSYVTTNISPIGEIDNRIMSISAATNGTDIFNVGTIGSGTHDKSTFKYCRISNLDTDNFIVIQMTDSSAKHWELILEAGKTLMFGDVTKVNNQADIDDYDDADASIVKVVGLADTAAVDIEVYIAST